MFLPFPSLFFDLRTRVGIKQRQAKAAPNGGSGKKIESKEVEEENFPRSFYARDREGLLGIYVVAPAGDFPSPP